MIEKVKKVMTNTGIKNIPGANKLLIALNLMEKFRDFFSSKKTKEEKIKQLEEKHKKDMETVRKIEDMITKDPPKNEEEKIKKDKELKQYFDKLLRVER